MSTEQIVEWVIAIIPSVISICTCVGIILKVIKEFSALKAQVADMKALEDLKKQLKDVLQENMQLKQTINQTLTKIDHVKRE